MIDDNVLLMLAGFVTGLSAMAVVWAAAASYRPQKQSPPPEPAWRPQLHLINTIPLDTFEAAPLEIMMLSQEVMHDDE